jgi:hypothetical protein
MLSLLHAVRQSAQHGVTVRLRKNQKYGTPRWQKFDIIAEMNS